MTCKQLVLHALAHRRESHMRRERTGERNKRNEKYHLTKSTLERNEEFYFGTLSIRIAIFIYIVCFSNFHLLRILVKTNEIVIEETRREKDEEKNKLW